ncbi:MAG: SBBP repeat-containing protein [Ignavibacteria bacterium]|nr:SBBP repeat-containing protein [Ignavibacteria bacterium]
MKKSKQGILTIMFSLALMLSFTFKSYAEPKQDWVARFNSYDKDDKAMAMTIDKEGFVYVTGYSEGKDGGKDFLTIKYGHSGKELWTATYSGSGNADGNDDIANAIAVDAEGNVLVTGSTHTGVTGRDYCTISYNSEGKQIWINHFSGIGSIEDSDEEATSIAVDYSGSVLVTGYSDGQGTGYDFHTIKYSPKGEMIWQISFDRQAGLDDKPVSVKTDEDGNVFVSGYSEGLGSGKDYFTIKYGESGKELWSSVYNGVGGNVAINEDEVRALTLDAAGNVYVTGYSFGAGTGKDIVTLKYDNNGKTEWISRVDNVSVQRGITNNEEAGAIAIDHAGNIFLTGKTVSPDGESDFYTVKLNPIGETQWTRNYSNEEFGGYGDDEALALAADINGNVIVTGFTSGFGLSQSCGYSKDFATIKYSANGELLWEKKYNGTDRFENSDDIAKRVVLDGKGGIFVMGESMGEETEMDYCLIRYEDAPRVKSPAEIKEAFRLNDNFPNPFNPSTKLSFDIPVSSKVRLAVYDITGREVALLENKVLQAGNYKYEWNASQFSSGTYFYKIQADGFVQTKRMILIK